jgi:hypothetical protein
MEIKISKRKDKALLGREKIKWNSQEGNSR